LPSRLDASVQDLRQAVKATPQAWLSVEISTCAIGKKAKPDPHCQLALQNPSAEKSMQLL
jgi:hypothetical protein